MMIDLAFILNSAGLGVGLAMDAFSVSLANGLHEPRMSRSRMSAIAGVYALFQYAMPMIGWICVETVLELFTSLRRAVPWIALALLLYIGGKMLLEGLRAGGGGEGAPAERRLGLRALLLQGLATSIDALSVGLTLAAYSAAMANLAALIIGGVTFGICLVGLQIGKRVGLRLSRKASVLGGVILIVIGLEIFLKGIL